MTDDTDEGEYLLNEDGNINELNTKLVTIKQNLNTKILSDIHKIESQRDQLKHDNKLIEQNKTQIQQLIELVETKENTSIAFNESLEESMLYNETNKFYHIIFLGINILLFVLIIIFTSITYSKPSSTLNSSLNLKNNKSNNIIKNVMSNVN